MYMVVHAAVGAAAGQAVVHNYAAFLLGVISHFFLDMIPHGDQGIYEGYLKGSKVRRALLNCAVDILLTVLLLVLLFSNPVWVNTSTVVWGVVGGLLPDVLEALTQMIHPKKKSGIFWRLHQYHRFHHWNHGYIMRRWHRAKSDVSFMTGLVYQGVLMFVLLKYVI